jgi:hypothetical protein
VVRAATAQRTGLDAAFTGSEFIQGTAGDDAVVGPATPTSATAPGHDSAFGCEISNGVEVHGIPDL